MCSPQSHPVTCVQTLLWQVIGPQPPQSFPHTQFAETCWPVSSWPPQDLLRDSPYTCFSNFCLKYWLASTLPNQINFLQDRLKVMLQIIKGGYREWIKSKWRAHECTRTGPWRGKKWRYSHEAHIHSGKSTPSHSKQRGHKLWGEIAEGSHRGWACNIFVQWKQTNIGPLSLFSPVCPSRWFKELLLASSLLENTLLSTCFTYSLAQHERALNHQPPLRWLKPTLQREAAGHFLK